MSERAINHVDKGAVAEPLWQALRRAERPVTLADLHRVSGAGRRSLTHRLGTWARVGLVQVLPPEPPLYSISESAADLADAPTCGQLSSDAWRALRQLGKPATLGEIVAATGAADRPLQCRLKRWRVRGYVEKVEAKPQRYALSPGAPEAPAFPSVTKGGEVKPRRRTYMDRVWKAIRILRTFDIPVLMMTAEVPRRSCDSLIIFLEHAGIVRKVCRTFRERPKPEDGSKRPTVVRGWSTYRLVRDLGPKPPMIREPREKGGNRHLVDTNTGEAFEIAVKPRRRRCEAGHGQ